MKKMTTNQIRQSWLDFFKSKQHLELPSQSLIPKDDPSLLWINSGVATLKKYFSGIETPPSLRLVNSQKALRTNDVLNVGVTSRHHTLFEMLGNFSIGDYFKKEAIEMAFELLTKYWEIDIDLIYVTTYEEDQESYDVWKKLGVKDSHIIKCDKNRNFWDIGQGPCGPCTEIFYDRGVKYDSKHLGVKLFQNDIENDRYVEIWNIVFSQFNNDGKNNYTPLARKNIDTGAGLERIASISQDVPTDFDTDQFQVMIQNLQKLSPHQYNVGAYFQHDLKQMNINRHYKIIVDHIKACVFAIADGGIPTSKDRGFVLRKLIRRAMLSARQLGIKTSFIKNVVNSVVQTNYHYYVYLKQCEEHIVDVIQKEEKLFNVTLESGLKIFQQFINNKTLNGETVFKLTDTYGFPYEIIVDLANEQGIKVDEKTFEEYLKHHQNISKAINNPKGMVSQNKTLLNFKEASSFDYNLLQINAKVIACFDENFNYIETLRNIGWLVFDKTVFYATSGGQKHDEGVIECQSNKFKIMNVIKGPNGQHFHKIDSNEHFISIGDQCILQIDQDVRMKLSRNHSIEHLIQATLQTKIDKSIRQEGAYKSPEKVTFDFHYHSRLIDTQIEIVENTINDFIKEAMVVETKLMSLEEAKKVGAIAWFENVYSKIKGQLRVVFIGNVSKEICGGTHVNNTKDIEQFYITSLENKGGSAWRLEGITGYDTIKKYLHEQIDLVQNNVNRMINEIKKFNINNKEFDQLVASLSYKISVDNFRKLQKQMIDLQKIYQQIMVEINKIQIQNAILSIKQTKIQNSKSGAVGLIEISLNDHKTINQALTQMVNEHPNMAFICLNKLNEKIQYIIIGNKNLSNFDASQIIKEMNHISGGSGGGRKEFAQGGTTNIDSLEMLKKYIINL